MRPQRTAAIILTCALAACGNPASTGGLPTQANREDSAAYAQQPSSPPTFIAVPLPAGFVPSIVKESGDIPGALGNSAAIYRDGKVRVLGSYDGLPTKATDIDSHGTAIGYALGSPNFNVALQFSHGQIVKMPLPAGCKQEVMPAFINDDGDVYGTCWNPYTTDYPNLARFLPSARLIDGRGYVTGITAQGLFSVAACSIEGCHAAVGLGLRIFVLPFSWPWSTANFMNDRGTIVGDFSNSNIGEPPIQAFEYTAAGNLRYLPFLGTSQDMEPTGINDAGDVVGMDETHNHMFLWTGGPRMHDISKHVTPAANYSIFTDGLSNSGTFVAATRSGNAFSYFLIQPSPPTPRP